MFISIMVDYFMSFLLMSTWKFFVVGKFRGSFLDFFTEGTLLSVVSFMEKSYGVVVVVVGGP